MGKGKGGKGRGEGDVRRVKGVHTHRHPAGSPITVGPESMSVP